MAQKRILVSRRQAATLAGMTSSHLRTLISRGRLVEQDALIGERIVKGVTLESLRHYFNWSQNVVDQLLAAHQIDPDSDGYHLMTARDETSPDSVSD